MRICYYISGHGYGHAVRSCAVCSKFPDGVEITFKTSVPEEFFKKEVSRNFSYFPAEFDCGCIQADGVTVNIKETLLRYMSIAEGNAGLLESEAAWCRDNGVDGIVGDIVPFAFEVADRAGIPSVAVSNFTWFDIYEPYAKRYPFFRTCLDKLRSQYRKAGLLLALNPPNSMDCFPRREVVPVVGKKGDNISDKIKKHYNISDDKKLALVYAGNFGLDSMSWNRLEHFIRWEFFGIYPIPVEQSNYHVIKKTDFRYEDFSASMDLAVAKVGYGVYSECLLNGIPLLYMPRNDFAEYPVLERGIMEWGRGFRLDKNAFYNLEWEESLNRAERTEKPFPIENAGASACARRIEEFILSGK